MPPMHFVFAALATLAMAGQAVAQTSSLAANPALRNLGETRIAVGIATGAGAREACGVTPALEASLFQAFRGELAGAGVPVQPRSSVVAASPTHNVHVGQPGVRSQPLIYLQLTVLGMRAGQQVVCSVSRFVIVQLRQTGGEVAQSRQPLPDELTVWSDDAASIAGAEDLPLALRQAAEQAGRRFAEAWGDANR